MKICGWRFNLYLWVPLALVLSLTFGCKTEAQRRKEQETVLRVHFETKPDNFDRSQPVMIGREGQAKVVIEKIPFLTERQVDSAQVTNTIGGFVLMVKFNQQGSWLLEQYSGASFGKRFAIFCQFKTDPRSSTNYPRWVAAPRISQRINDGTLIFTPDATREEAENIALGLNNVGRRMKKMLSW